MLIHNLVATGSLSYNGVNISYVTGSQTSLDGLNQFSASVNTTTGSLNTATGSLFTASGSFSTRVTRIEGNYATTGSNVFLGAQTVCANITSTGTIIAQTLNVQQVTSSIVYSSGSNTFGCLTTDRQQFTGSVLVTGSLIVTTAGTSPEFQVGVGGTVKGNALTDVHQVTGSLRITGSVIGVGNACITSVCSPAFVGGTVSGTTGTFTGTVCGGTGVFGNTGAGSFSLAITNNDQSNARIRLTNTGTGGGIFSLVAGNPGASNAGLAVIDENCSSTRMYFTSAGEILVGANSRVTGLSGFTQFEVSAVEGGITINSNCTTTERYSRLMFTKSNATGNEGLIRYNVNDYHMSLWTNANERLRITCAGIACFACQVCTTSAALSANIIFNRASTSAGNNIEWRTASTLNWYIGTRGLVDNNFYIVNEGLSTNNLTLDATTGAANFTSNIDGIARLALNNSNAGTSARSFLYAITTGNRYLGMIAYGANATGTNSGLSNASLSLLQSGGDSSAFIVQAGGTSAPLVFSTCDTERMRITSAGNVGIGITSPATNLDVRAFNRNSCLATLRIGTQCDGGTGDEFANIEFYWGDPDAAEVKAKIYTKVTGNVGPGGGGAADLLFATTPAFGSSTERMRITSGGNVDVKNNLLIGTGINATQYISISENQIQRVGNGTFFINNSSTGDVSININGGCTFVNGTNGYGRAVTNSSDERIKKNITTIENALDKVLQMNGVYYEFNSENTLGVSVPSDNRRVGLIAQQIEDILPESVFTPNESNQPKSIDYNGMIGLIVNAVKEQQCKINILESCLGIN